MTTRERCAAALNRLAKWRSVFAGWQLGTRAMEDPEACAVRDHREATLLLRVETTTLLRLMLNKGLLTPDEFNTALTQEAELYCKDLERRFPGFKSTDIGMHLDVSIAADTMRVMHFKP